MIPQQAMETALLVLAAGASTRMGSPKATLPLFGRPLLELHIAAGLALKLHPVIIVLGHQAELLEAQLDLSGAASVINATYTRGQFSSLQTGLQAIDARRPAATCPPVLLTPVDCPPVAQETVRQLGEALTLRPSSAAIVPTCEGRPGHPVLLAPPAISAVLGSSDDSSLERVLTSLGDRVIYLETSDPSILWNLNRPEDVQRYLSAAPRPPRM